MESVTFPPKFGQNKAPFTNEIRKLTFKYVIYLFLTVLSYAAIYCILFMS